MADQLTPLLLDLLAGTSSEELVSALTLPDWKEIDRIGAQHRLRPLLSSRLADCIHVPLQFKELWAERRRHSALRALKQRAALINVDRLLFQARIKAKILKGGSLVWNGWVDPALRPMRDLDLLVDEAQALHAHAILRDAGFTGVVPDQLTRGKHLPGLTSRDGVMVELHTHLYDTNSVAAIEQEERSRALALSHSDKLTSPGLQAISSLSDSDLLLHLIIHAALDHRFNNGPLLILDLALLLEHGHIEWPRFWSQAEDAQALRAAELTLGMAMRWPLGTAHPRIDWHDYKTACPSATLIEEAGSLMLVDMTRNRSLGWAGQLASAGPAHYIQRLSTMLKRAQRKSYTISHIVPDNCEDRDRLTNQLLDCGRSLFTVKDRRHLYRSVRIATWLRQKS